MNKVVYKKQEDDCASYSVAPKVQQDAAGNIQTKASESFDEAKIPADWQVADNHRKAMDVGRDSTVDTEKCGCCARTINRTPIKVLGNIMDLAFLGSGIPLYFSFIKWCIILLLVIFVTSGDYNILTNFYYGQDCINRESCPEDWSTLLSLANKRSSKDMIDIQQLLNIVSILVMVFIFQMFRSSQRDTQQLCDDLNKFASEYTIMVKGIPKTTEGLLDNDYDADLLEFFRTYLDQNGLNFFNHQIIVPVAEEVKEIEETRKQTEKTEKNYKPYKRVLAINLVYSQEKILSLTSEIQVLISQQQQVLSNLYKEGAIPDTDQISLNEEIIEIRKQIQQKQQEEKDFFELLGNGKGQEVQEYFLGIAFVKFMWQSDRDYFFKENKTTLIYRGVDVSINRPPEPSDVYWENLHITNEMKIKRRIIGYLVTTLVLGLCTLTIYYLTIYQQIASTNGDESNLIIETQPVLSPGEPLPKEPKLVKILAVFCSILVVIINNVLAMVIRHICVYESFSTQTGFNISVARKSSIAQFCNTALITFLMSIFITKNIYNSGGLVFNITRVFISNSTIPILMDFLDIGSKITQLLQWLERKKNYKCLKSQSQLNIFMEKPALDISAKYAIIIKNLYFAAFYASIVPISLVITSGWLILFYFLEKYNICRRRTLKYSIGEEISIEMTEMLEMILPIYCATNFYWSYVFLHEISTLAIVGLIIGILNAILPMDYINKQMFQPQDGIEKVEPLCEVSDKFLSDYESENPATSDKTKIEAVKRAQKKEMKKNAILISEKNNLKAKV